jgi:hypothetical protein
VAKFLQNDQKKGEFPSARHTWQILDVTIITNEHKSVVIVRFVQKKAAKKLPGVFLFVSKNHTPRRRTLVSVLVLVSLLLAKKSFKTFNPPSSGGAAGSETNI